MGQEILRFGSSFLFLFITPKTFLSLLLLSSLFFNSMQLLCSSEVQVRYLLTLRKLFLFIYLLLLLVVVVFYLFIFFFMLASPDGIKFPVTGSKWSKRCFNNNAFRVFYRKIIDNNEYETS